MTAMSKTWIGIALISQFLLIVMAYHLFYSETSNSPQAFTPVSMDSFVTWKNLQQKSISTMDSKETNETMEDAAKLIKDINWKEIPQKPAPPAKEIHDKWIVITTINSPTADVKKLAGIEGWKVVVVGDTKTPKDWR